MVNKKEMWFYFKRGVWYWVFTILFAAVISVIYYLFVYGGYAVGEGVGTILVLILAPLLLIIGFVVSGFGVTKSAQQVKGRR
jgi:hypothetical protein